MAKQRYVNTKFWNDAYIVDLNPLEKYLFIYLLTNEHTNICGIYELTLRVMAFETGIDKEMLPKMLERFNGKVKYIDNWVCLKNFMKHQSTSSIKVKTGIEDNLALIPPHIIDKLIEYGYPIHRVRNRIIYSNSNINPNINTSGEKSPAQEKAKSPTHQLTNYYFEVRGWDEQEPGFYKENNISYGRNAKRAKELLELCEGDLEKAKAVIDRVKDWAEGRGLEWTIETIFKKWPEIEAGKL